MMLNFYSPQIQTAAQTTFVTTCAFPFWRNKTKCNKTSNHQTFCHDVIHFDSCIINFQPVVYTVLPTTKEILE